MIHVTTLMATKIGLGILPMAKIFEFDGAAKTFKFDGARHHDQ